MSKKDRIALVLSVIFIGFAVAAAMDESYASDKLQVFLTLMVVPTVYWGYRFIKGDISFLKMKSED